MTNYAPGEIVLIDFPFVSGAASVLRPALVVLDAGDSDVVLARITTQPHRSAYDVEIVDWQGAGLRMASFIRLHKLVTAEKSVLNRRLGKLQTADYQRAAVVFKAIVASW